MRGGLDCRAWASRCPGGRGWGTGSRRPRGCSCSPPSLGIAVKHTLRFFIKTVHQRKMQTREGAARAGGGGRCPGAAGCFLPAQPGSSGASSLPQFPRGARPVEGPGPDAPEPWLLGRRPQTLRGPGMRPGCAHRSRQHRRLGGCCHCAPCAAQRGCPGARGAQRAGGRAALGAQPAWAELPAAPRGSHRLFHRRPSVPDSTRVR